MTAPYTISTGFVRPDNGRWVHDRPATLHVDDDECALRLFEALRAAYAADVDLWLYDPAGEPITHALGTRRTAR